MDNLIIPMFDVKSGNIKQIGYDAQSLTLRVRFKASSVLYDYKGVAKEIFMEFMGSDSKGKYFFTKVKGKYEFDKN